MPSNVSYPTADGFGPIDADGQRQHQQHGDEGRADDDHEQRGEIEMLQGAAGDARAQCIAEVQHAAAGDVTMRYSVE